MNFVLRDEYDNLAAGIEVLKKLTDGKVHLGLRNGENGVLNRLTEAEQHLFQGPHPAGNVGVQIHHIDPINKGDIVWTVDIQNVALIGRLFNTGTADMHPRDCRDRFRDGEAAVRIRCDGYLDRACDRRLRYQGRRTCAYHRRQRPHRPENRRFGLH